jgi:ABC-type nickel/cobalt efflux system permease component RcnA
LLFLVSLLPGVLLVFLSIIVALLFIHELLTNPRVQCASVLLLIALGILWWIWSQLPLWFRKAIYRMLQRKRQGERPNGGRQ